MKLELRDSILLLLRDGPRTTGELAKELSAGSTTINHACKRLLDEGCLEHEHRGDYRLSEVGLIEADLIASRVVLREQAEFWQGHDLSGIPRQLLACIGDLSGCRVVRDGDGDFLKSQQEFISAVSQAKTIYGVSPIIAPGYPDMIAGLVAGGADVHLILTREVIGQIDPARVGPLCECMNFHLHIASSARVAFTVADDCLFMGLYRLDGRYDLDSDLVCQGESGSAVGVGNHTIELSAGNLSYNLSESGEMASWRVICCNNTGMWEIDL